jgi:hypothetical protein
MSCERCGGLMVIEICCDLMVDKSRKGIDTTRCVNCGNLEDTIIRTNRASSHSLRHCEPRTAGARRLTAIQPRSTERARQTAPVIVEGPRVLAPCGPLPLKEGR